MPALWGLILGLRVKVLRQAPTAIPRTPTRSGRPMGPSYPERVTRAMGLRERLCLARLHLITDIRRDEGDWPEFVASVLDGGVDLIQVRDLVAPRRERLDALKVAIAMAAERDRGVVVGADAALAAVVSADYLHLGAADGPVADNRVGLPATSLVGRSVHSPAQVREALADGGVSYLFVGPVFAGADVREVPGLDLVRTAEAETPCWSSGALPWFAVGGITAARLDEVLDAGARRIAVSAAITRADDPGHAARHFSDRLRAAWDADPAADSYVRAVAGACRETTTPRS